MNRIVLARLQKSACFLMQEDLESFLAECSFSRLSLYLSRACTDTCDSRGGTTKCSGAELTSLLSMRDLRQPSLVFSVLMNVVASVIVSKQLLCRICAPDFSNFFLSYSGWS